MAVDAEVLARLLKLPKETKIVGVISGPEYARKAGQLYLVLESPDFKAVHAGQSIPEIQAQYRTVYSEVTEFERWL